MKRYWIVSGFLLSAFLGVFLLVDALRIPLLVDPSPWLDRGGLGAAVIGVGLLIIDVVLPVPSSLVMVMHGAMFGVVVGTLLSLGGSIGAALVGYAIGRRGGQLATRALMAGERDRADQLVRRWGTVAIIASRPVPMLAETVAIMAGVSRMSWQRVTLASAAGSLPAALLYALAGAVASNLGTTLMTFVLVLAIAGIAWLAGPTAKRIIPDTTGRREASPP